MSEGQLVVLNPLGRRIHLLKGAFLEFERMTGAQAGTGEPRRLARAVADIVSLAELRPGGWSLPRSRLGESRNLGPGALRNLLTALRKADFDEMLPPDQRGEEILLWPDHVSRDPQLSGYVNWWDLRCAVAETDDGRAREALIESFETAASSHDPARYLSFELDPFVADRLSDELRSLRGDVAGDRQVVTGEVQPAVRVVGGRHRPWTGRRWRRWALLAAAAVIVVVGGLWTLVDSNSPRTRLFVDAESAVGIVRCDGPAAGRCFMFRSSASQDKTVLLKQGQALSLSLDVPRPGGRYRVVLTAMNDGDADRVDVSVNGVLEGSVDVRDGRPSGGEPGSGWDVPQEVSPPNLVTLPGGRVTVDLLVPSAGPDQQGVEFDKVTLIREGG